MRHYRWVSVAALLGWMLAGLPLAGLSQGQPETPYFSRKNSFGVFAAYANDSSHILLGLTQNRKLVGFGGSYSRRLWQGRVVNWQYNAEVQPVALESDPVVHEVIVYTQPFQITAAENFVPDGVCRPGTGSFNQTVNETTFAYTYTNTCSRRWTMGEGMSPVGMAWNFLPRHRLQPVVTGHGGYMYSTQPIPVTGAGSFNFTFDFGVGFELYRTKTQSVRAEYRYHHISNGHTATQNPGIDNGVVQVTYSFGR